MILLLSLVKLQPPPPPSPPALSLNLVRFPPPPPLHKTIEYPMVVYHICVCIAGLLQSCINTKYYLYTENELLSTAIQENTKWTGFYGRLGFTSHYSQILKNIKHFRSMA